LFGYEGGAFTGAKRQGKAGLFEIADKGTLFLDEIAEMPGGCQAKILRAIQDKVIRRIGGDREIPVNARIITATNRNLENMVATKAFRQDLYYRINVLPIHIPPLRERIGDIPALVEHFLFQLSSKLGKRVPSLSPQAMDKLLRHNWPGNIRELKNVIERGAILCDEDRIEEHCILFSSEIGFNRHVSTGAVDPNRKDGEPLKVLVGRYEKQIICETLKKTDSIRQAARRLRLSHTALLNKLRKYGIQMETNRTIGNKIEHNEIN
jgi:transcriptional regulator of aroF, aroG, tyrA and aromatic amino acid transport